MKGLEAGTVYVYGGDIDVVSSDDGINVAGGSSNGTDPGAPGTGGDGFQSRAAADRAVPVDREAMVDLTSLQVIWEIQAQAVIMQFI